MPSDTDEAPVPPQWQAPNLYDFRHAPDGPRGFKVAVTKYGNMGTKRKLEEYSEQVSSVGVLGRLPPRTPHMPRFRDAPISRTLASPFSLTGGA